MTTAVLPTPFRSPKRYASVISEAPSSRRLREPEDSAESRLAKQGLGNEFSSAAVEAIYRAGAGVMNSDSKYQQKRVLESILTQKNGRGF